ncbi:hypothetical protein [Chitinophaga sp. ARDCPP14]|uniref:acyl carrier protein n=1 Tax=Chitinophaga sp. ARDCPP14 TaxID=3391139 RepID=UPI003F523B8F
MGLDSIDLLVEIENYFGIQIPDIEAAEIFTVQNMVDVAAKHLHVADHAMDLKAQVFQQVADSISSTNHEIKLTDKISTYLSPGDQKSWSALKNHLRLEVPQPDIFARAPKYDWTTITIDQFTTSICARNFKTLIDKNEIKSKYEVYVIVMGITVAKTGVDYYEITPDKSFTSDLGID